MEQTTPQLSSSAQEPTSSTRRTFADAIRTPAQSSAPSELPPAVEEGGPASPTAAAAAHEAPKKAKKPHLAKNGGVNSGNQAARRKATAEAVQSALETGKRAPAAAGATGTVKEKKGGRVAVREEAKAAAAATAKPAKQKTKKKSKLDELYGADGDEDVLAEEALKPFAYTRAKPAAITGALFMWESVAAFSTPAVALRLSLVCRDVAQRLRASHAGTHLMQRYWNAQWARLVWEPSELTDEKRYLLPSSLSRSEGKIDWKKKYREEYPLWMQRTYAGIGSNNNANNVAKALFHKEQLNEVKTAAELARTELTLKEALLKAQMKRGVEVEVNNEDGAGSDAGSVDGAMTRAGRRGGGVGGSGAGGGPAIKGLRGARVPVHDPSAGYTRADYKQNYREGARKGKHRKGGDKKWESYAALEDDDY